jgi:hypothetical protein
MVVHGAIVAIVFYDTDPAIPQILLYSATKMNWRRLTL